MNTGVIFTYYPLVKWELFKLGRIRKGPKVMRNSAKYKILLLTHCAVIEPR